MQVNSSKTVIATGIVAIGVIILSLLIMWKHSADTADNNLHHVEELRQSTAYIDKMRQIALNRTSLLNDMRSIDDPFILDHHFQEMGLLASEFMTTRDKLLNLSSCNEIALIWKNTAPLINKTGKAQRKAAMLMLDNRKQEADKVLLNEAFPFQSKAQKQLSRLLDVQQSKSEKALAQAQENKINTYINIATIGSISLVLTIGIMILVVRMTRQIQKDLHRADEAKLANKMKSEFLANMSHEIRTPLAAIIGYADASLDTDQSIDERLKGTQRIIYNGNHLLSLINDILDLSKVEAGKLEMEQVAVSPIQVANEACNITKINAKDKQLLCEIDYTLPLPKEMIGDPTRIKQALINLLSNAIKFTEQGHIYLKISYSLLEEKVIFEVEDTGIGITEEQQSTIFNPFIQAEASTTRKYGGTGLGLALTKDLIEKMGGELTVQSKVGVGSCFTIKLGRGKPNDSGMIYNYNEILSLSQSINKPRESLLQLHGKVLLVEDNKDIQRLLSRYMDKMGVDVTIAHNGADALEICANNEFDLIFMDMQMPIMDGPSTTKKLRELGCDKPIVALTANAYKEDKERCLSAGCNDFVTKPVARDHLQQVLSKYLDSDQEQRPDMTPIVSSLLEDEPALSDFVYEFNKRLPHTISAVRKALAEKNWNQMKALIHDIKGSAGSVGFPQLTEVAAQTEFQLLNRDYTKVENLTEKIEILADRIIAGNELQIAKLHLAN